MSFETVLADARSRFGNNGKFSLLAHESIDDVVKRESIPNARGIYIIFTRDDDKRPVYIGRAGTLNQDGTWKKQGLAHRLTMKQGGVNRREFFRNFVAIHCATGLTFHWFVTHDESSNVLPALAEMQLLQAHFEQYGYLPDLNRCA